MSLPSEIAANDYGAQPFADGDTIPLPSDGTGSAGDAVTFDTNGQLTPVSATGDEFVGVLAEDSPAAGEDVRVNMGGVSVARAGGSLSRGDIVRPDGSDAGAVVTSAEGSYASIVTDGSSTTYELHTRHPRALSDAADGEKVLLRH